MEGNQTFKGSWPWPWPWIRPYGIPSCITHRPLPIYRISFKSKKLFVDGRTDVRTDIFLPSNIIRSTFGSRPNNATSMHYYIQILSSAWDTRPAWRTAPSPIIDNSLLLYYMYSVGLLSRLAFDSSGSRLSKCGNWSKLEVLRAENILKPLINS